MRLGVHLPQFREPVAGEVLAEAARIAEEAGADDIWVSDHLILPVGSERPPASFHDPLTVLTWALGVPFAERGRRTDATIAICRALWRGETSYTWEEERIEGVRQRLAERTEALERALGAAGRSRTEVVLSVRVRAGAERVQELTPRLRELGVDHLLVDPPAFSLSAPADEVAALRRVV